MVERVRTTMRRLPILTWLLAAAVFLTALLILTLGSGWGSRLRGLGLALLPAAVVVGVVGLMLTLSLDGLTETLAPAWPPPDVTTSAGLTQASMALFGGIIGGIGEQLLRAAIVTFAVAVGLIAASLADLLGLITLVRVGVEGSGRRDYRLGRGVMADCRLRFWPVARRRTVPAVASNSIVAPSGRRSVAWGTFTTAGMLYSRATMEPCES